MSETNKRSLSDRIGSHLWILLAFVPYLNGVGFIYVGSKTFRNKWVIEGAIYEIPWLIYFILAIITPDNKANIIFVIFGVVLEIVSIIRSIKINSEYQSVIDSEQYRKSKGKFQTLVGTILSITPFINGLPFIYFGNKFSKKSLTLLGILFEVLWILALITRNVIFGSLAIGFIIVSLVSFIYINYNDSNLSYSTRPANKPSYVPEKEAEEKPAERDTSNWRDYFEKTSPKGEEKTYDKKAYEKEEPVVEDPYEKYELEVSDLSEEFDKKEKKVTEIVEQRFNDSITRDRFMEIILEARDTFNREKNAINSYIELSRNDPMNLEDDIRKKIGILKKIIKKINELILELLKNTHKDEDIELENLFDEMENLTDSVKNYK